jgi:holo-[acyl-carrier protein] synthase
MSNIIGLGLDATDIDRIADTIDRWGERFLRRIFTDGEVAYCTRRRVPAIHFAGRFAAKEAAMKALGTGWADGVAWRDFEVVRVGRQAPALVLRGRAAALAQARGMTRWLVALSHSGATAIAWVLAEGEPTAADASTPRRRRAGAAGSGATRPRSRR